MLPPPIDPTTLNQIAALRMWNQQQQIYIQADHIAFIVEGGFCLAEQRAAGIPADNLGSSQPAMCVETNCAEGWKQCLSCTGQACLVAQTLDRC
ncbi:hypothetical protein PGT21_002019 [Puccinia graminis f. sp. tritici]|uniref:Uncharacterized protein n=1 Tax=Puccinia graminis f. sp. tritici TaxID=56615 RepID=A0A5B0RHT5_PUCGR|nr:hypothetical protein PGT21_002019 [Puccinia graminis f. sp. tritici]KAA1124475.1 hypothetical protein PGTUg99_033616 [Puccinia graminis f. sp. tritici]